MPTENTSNNVFTTLSGNGGSITSSATTFVVASSSNVPAVPFRAAIGPIAGDPTEIVLVTLVSGTTWTATRGYEATPGSGTGAGATHNDGDQVAVVWTAAGLVQLLEPAPFWGDGSTADPNLTSGTTTLVADMFYANLTVTSPAILDANGFRIYVKSTLAGTGTIQSNGGNGGNAGAAGLPAGQGTSPFIGWIGGTTTTTNGNAGGTTGNCSYGGNGGNGGHGSGTNTGGAGGSANQAITDQRRGPYGMLLVETTTAQSCQGGAGGGGGAGDGTAGGGGGGGGGGIAIAARISTFTGTIRANGGNGGSPAAGNRGGGGGGGGGFVVVHSTSAQGSATLQANGGTKGTHSGSSPAADGVNGSAGSTLWLQWAR